jgi:PKD repeat protein
MAVRQPKTKYKEEGDMKNKIWLFGLVVLLSLIPIAVLAQNEPPVADAGPDQSVYTGDSAVLQGTATDPDDNPIIYWHWVVVDAPTNSTWFLSGDANPVAYLTPNNPGDYVLAFVVGDAYAYSSPDYVTVHVADNLPPVAVATADKTSGPAPLTVCFDGSQSYDPEGGPLLYDWDFNDGSNAQVAALCHTFLNAGTYTVTFGVGDVRGAWDFEVLSIVANQITNHPPVSSPTVTPQSGSAPLAVQFTANASDPDGDALTYAWDFGDGATSTEENPAHTYEASGSFVAWLTVSDGADAVSVSLPISVSPGIDLNVTRAEIQFKGRQSTLASVEIQAELYASIPAPDDVVAIYLDGAEVFAAPFSDFVLVQEHGQDVPGVYKLKAKHLWVKIDFVDNWLSVDAGKVALPGYDPANGVNIEVMLGEDVAVDNIQPVDDKADRHYRHHRLSRGWDHCGGH